LAQRLFIQCGHARGADPDRARLQTRLVGALLGVGQAGVGQAQQRSGGLLTVLRPARFLDE
jgi:hypothetical protein